MAAPLVFNEFTGWVDVADPQNIPPGTRLIASADLLRYENFLAALRDRVNSHDTSLVSTVDTVADLVSDLAAAVAVNTTQAGQISTLQTELDAAEANIAALTRGVSINSVSVTMVKANRIYVHTGGAATLTLPNVAGNTGVDFIVKNRGTASITVQAESNKIWNTSIATAMALGIGSYIVLHNDGTFWNRIG